MGSYGFSSPGSLLADRSLREGDEETDATRDQFRVREGIRNECRSALLHCASNDRTAMTLRDVTDYFQKGLTEASLSYVESEREKTEELRLHRERYVPEFIRQAESAGVEALAMIDRASQNKWISPESANRWKHRLKGQGSTWLQKKEFIEKTLPRYLGNWEKLHRDFEALEKEAKEQGLTKADWSAIPEFARLRSWKKFEEKRHLVDQAWAYLKAHRGKIGLERDTGEMKALYAKAKKQLETAVKAGALSPWKVGTWLRRIFESDASKEKIQNFIHGKGDAPLSALINNWIEVRKEFDSLERRRKMEGTPASFHFVHLNIFLDWNFEQRKSYLKEANNRFQDIGKERYDFLQIRHALDAEDWEDAGQLIAKASREDLTEQERDKLRSMERYLASHRPAAAKEAGGEDTESPDAIIDSMERALSLIPHASIRNRFREAMRRGYDTLWALCTMNYNWEWCRLHGFSDEKIDHRLRTTAKKETYHHLKYGQPRGQANNDLTTDTSVKPAARSDHGTRSPQVLNVDATTKNFNLVEYVHENRYNRDVWYWTRIVEKDIPFADVQYIIHHIQPLLKSGMRKLKAMGVDYDPSASSHRSAHPKGKK